MTKLSTLAAIATLACGFAAPAFAHDGTGFVPGPVAPQSALFASVTAPQQAGSVVRTAPRATMPHAVQMQLATQNYGIPFVGGSG